MSPSDLGSDRSPNDHRTIRNQSTAASRLNGARDIAKRVDKALRTESEMGSVKVTSARTFSVSPSNGVAALVIGSLPRLTSLGMSATTDAKEILEIAAAVEAAL